METATTDGKEGIERMAKMDVVVPAFFETWIGRKGFWRQEEQLPFCVVIQL